MITVAFGLANQAQAKKTGVLAILNEWHPENVTLKLQIFSYEYFFLKSFNSEFYIRTSDL